MIAVISKSRGIYAKKGWIDERMNSSPEWTVIGGAEKRQESGGVVLLAGDAGMGGRRCQTRFW